MKIIKRPELGRLVTPAPNQRLPVHNWFSPKEGFSREFVAMIINAFWLYKGDSVLDPFSGGGTTPLTCKEFGIDCVGLDVHPLMVLASRAKINDYDLNILQKVSEELLKSNGASGNRPEKLEKFFPPPVFEELCPIRERILELEGIERDFFSVALIRASMECSFVEKDGVLVKVKERPVPRFKPTFSKIVGWMLDDLSRLKVERCKVEVRERDAREPLEEKFDAVITSPPYLNKREYEKSYWVEEMLCGLKPKPPECFIGGGDPVDEVEDFLPEDTPEVKSYFSDIFRVLTNLHRCCREGARLAIVVSDAGFEDRVVPVCEPMASLAEEVGFEVRKLIIVNERYCTTPSRKKIGKMQEGILMLDR